MSGGLLDLIHLVARLRAATALVKREHDISKTAWETANEQLIGQLHTCQADLATVEDELRRQIVEAYRLTGDKRPGPGVGIRLRTVAEYDATEAKVWAIEHHVAAALELNRRVFDKIAEAANLPFVTVVQEPQATIATDLAGAIESGQSA